MGKSQRPLCGSSWDLILCYFMSLDGCSVGFIYDGLDEKLTATYYGYGITRRGFWLEGST